MAIQYAVFVAPTLLPNAATSLYTQGAASTGLPKKCTMTNHDSVAHAVTVELVPNGDAAGTTYKIYDAVVIPPQTVNGGFVDLYGIENHILQAGDQIYAYADTASEVTIMISGAKQY